MGVLDNVQRVSETAPYVKLLLYGPPGSGKTSFAAQAPRPLFLDFERSTEVLRYTPGYENTEVLVPKSVADFHAAIKDAPGAGFETIVIDSISQLQDFQLEKHMAEKFKDKKGDIKRYLPLFQEFRISTEVMKEAFRILQGMDINVILVAHARTHTEKRESAAGETVDRPVAIGPEMTPRVNEAARRLLNVLAYYEKEYNAIKKETVRKLYLNDSGLIRAKNRLGIQEIYLENPSWKTLFKDKNIHE